MPIYEYVCPVCGHKFEKIFLSTSHATGKVDCPKCESKANRAVEIPAKMQWGPKGRGF